MSVAGTTMRTDKLRERFALLSRFMKISPAYILVFVAVLFAASWASIRIAQQTGGVATIWLTNGFLLAALFKAPTRHWTMLAVAAFATNFLADILMGYGVATGCAFSSADLVEVLIIAVPMRRFGLDQDIRDLRSLMVFLALAFGLAMVSSAVVAASYLKVAQGAPFMESAAGWYMADGLGLIQVAPAAMLVRRTDIAALIKREQFLPALASIAVLAFVYAIMIKWPTVPLGFLLFPCILVLAFQQSYAGVAFGLMLITAVIITEFGSWPRLSGDGPVDTAR